MAMPPADGPAPPHAALSTMWAVQPRFEADIASFLTAAAEAGFAGIEVNHSMDPRQARTLIEAAHATGLEARSLHAPAPWALVDGDGPLAGRENRTLNLASLDEAERRLAVAHHVRSIEVAARASMRAVVVHLGGIGELDAALPTEDWLRREYLEWFGTGGRRGGSTGSPRTVVSESLAGGSGRTTGRSVRPERAAGAVEGPAVRGGPPSSSEDVRTTEAYLTHLEAARRERAAVAGPWLEAARRSLAELAPRAAHLGVTLGLECRLRYHEFPLPEEAADLLREHAPDVAGYWHDVGHAEVLHRLGLVPLEAWRELLATRLAGVHIHDVAGLTDHRAPGAVQGGTGVDFAALASMLSPSALRTFEVDQHEPPAALASGLLTVRTAGVVG
jgi:sugar phosphate isomerase/epimerase